LAKYGFEKQVVQHTSTGRFVCRFADRADSGNFIGFLEELRKRFGRILEYLDNAGYHKSAAVKKYPDDHEVASCLGTFLPTCRISTWWGYSGA